MSILNQSVKHIMFGLGIIKEKKDNKIWIQFQDEEQTKIFLYPEGFEKFLKAENPEVQSSVLEELHRKQEQIRMEMEIKAAELEEQLQRTISEKSKTRGTRRKKA